MYTAPFDDKYLPLGSTYSAHTLACAASLAAIDIYEKEELNNQATGRDQYIYAKMADS